MRIMRLHVYAIAGRGGTRPDKGHVVAYLHHALRPLTILKCTHMNSGHDAVMSRLRMHPWGLPIHSSIFFSCRGRESLYSDIFLSRPSNRVKLIAQPEESQSRGKYIQEKTACPEARSSPLCCIPQCRSGWSRHSRLANTCG